VSNDVITNGGFSLNPDVMARFTSGPNTENIFTAISTSQQNNSGGTLGGNWRSTDVSNPPGARLDNDFYEIATLDTNDQRGQQWYVLANAGQSNQLTLLTRFNQNWFSVPVLHLAEMLLIRGESAAELGNAATATADLNAIRNRAGATPALSGLDAASLILLLRAERRLELVGEGHRLQDLKRQGARGVIGVLINGAPWNCNGMAVQLPDEELAGNPSIILNPAGGC
jgi:starch-binding outer membrane protein, SusD/RagB family